MSPEVYTLGEGEQRAYCEPARLHKTYVTTESKVILIKALTTITFI